MSAANAAGNPPALEAITEPQLISKVEQFYFREARMLDERQFQQWLGLLAEEIEYTIPSRFIATPDPGARGTEAFHQVDNELERTGPGSSPLRQENIFTLAIRVNRAFRVNAWAENPPARTRRYITNVEVYQGADGYQAFSNFLLVFNRHDNASYQYTGQRRDTLKRVDGQLRIARREVIHDWNVIDAPTMGLFF